MKLIVELDSGETVSLACCQYVLWDGCGCPRGVIKASSSYCVTEEDAWREFFPRKRDREAAQSKGQRMELMTHDRYCAEVMPLMLQRECPHEQVIA